MPDEKKPPQEQTGHSEPFGAGLGPDFTPLGRRIVIGPRNDQAKLKRRQSKQTDKAHAGKTPSDG